MENKKVTVKIFGEVYTFTTNKSEDYLNKIAEYVDKHMWKACTSVKDPRNNKVQLLAAINIAEEHFETKASINDYRKRIISNEEEINYYKDVIEEIDRDKNRLNIENQAAKQLCIEKEQAIYELNNKLESLESALFDIKNQNVKLSNEVSKLEYENEDLKSNIESLNSKIENLNNSIVELNSSIEEKTTTIGNLNKTNDELNASVGDLNATIEELKASMPPEPVTILDELKGNYNSESSIAELTHDDTSEPLIDYEEEGSLFTILAESPDEKE